MKDIDKTWCMMGLVYYDRHYTTYSYKTCALILLSDKSNTARRLMSQLMRVFWNRHNPELEI